MEKMLDSAIRYAEKKCPIFPIREQDKAPATIHGYLDSTTDLGIIREWWSKNPNYNIGMPTGEMSGIVVIDIDNHPEKSRNGFASLRYLERLYGTLPATAEVQTGSGGKHLYFKYPSGHTINNSTDKLAEGIDVRGQGGYVVVPPSVHQNGNRYVWTDSKSAIVDLPEGWIKALEKKDNMIPVKTTDTGIVYEGGRTNYLVSFAGRMINLGADPETSKSAIRSENVLKCNPPLSENELNREVFPILYRNLEVRNSGPDAFHEINRYGKPSRVIDNKVFEYICQTEHIFFLGQIPYIYEHGVYKADINGATLKSKIRSLIYPDLRTANVEDRIYKLFLNTSSLQKTDDQINQYPLSWINFKNGMYDAQDRVMHDHDPRYLAINQIPHDFYPERSPTGSCIDEWLDFITTKSDEREMLLQYCGYCMTRDIRQQVFLILFGTGGSGKSTLIRLLQNVIGMVNISNVSLKELSNQRFATYDLYGKLVNSCADLETGALEDPSMIKKLLGEDSIRGEAKGKQAFSFNTYCKLIFSTNELPIVLSEKTNGFYRRLLVLPMNRVPETVKPDFLDDLLNEVDYFIYLCVDALGRMYASGTIVYAASSKEAVQELREDSDSVEAWINSNCIKDPEASCDRRGLYADYENYCQEAGRTALQRPGFYKSLRLKRYNEKTVQGIRMFVGLKINFDR